MDISSNAQKITMLPFNLKQVFLITEGSKLSEFIEKESWKLKLSFQKDMYPSFHLRLFNSQLFIYL